MNYTEHILISGFGWGWRFEDTCSMHNVPPPRSPAPVVASRDLAARVLRISEDSPAISEDSHDSRLARTTV